MYITSNPDPAPIYHPRPQLKRYPTHGERQENSWNEPEKWMCKLNLLAKHEDGLFSPETSELRSLSETSSGVVRERQPIDV